MPLYTTTTSLITLPTLASVLLDLRPSLPPPSSWPARPHLLLTSSALTSSTLDASSLASLTTPAAPPRHSRSEWYDGVMGVFFCQKFERGGRGTPLRTIITTVI